MSRKPRSYMKASFFHIVVQGIQKNYIFNTKEDIEKYIEIFEDKYEGITILAYCVMNNHSHFLVEPNSVDTMGKWMHKVNTAYAKYYNKKYERKGHLFNNRYYSEEIANDKHLYACIKYIHDNPVKAKICACPEEYAYSSFTKYYKGDILNVANKLGYALDTKIRLNNIKSIFEKYELAFFEDKEDKEIISDEFLKEVENNYGIQIKDIKEDEILIEVVRIFRQRFKLSYRLIEKKLEIGREKIRKIVNESKW